MGRIGRFQKACLDNLFPGESANNTYIKHAAWGYGGADASTVCDLSRDLGCSKVRVGTIALRTMTGLHWKSGDQLCSVTHSSALMSLRPEEQAGSGDIGGTCCRTW